MDWCHYRFRSVWDLPRAPAAVFAVLERAEEYPRWWPEVREVTPLDDLTATSRLRSLVPYDLYVTGRESRRDPAALVLEAELGGDLEGWVRWTLAERPGGTRVVYEQEVEVRKPLMRRFALPGRPLFRANHALMMRSGRRGLRRWLEREQPSGTRS
ncbi:SRPBCC family protein [Streptomyces sp. NPDC059161]|uniref:SRPBCC family protein n=1 Tax=Streptomyces sp. NPDC059161 TaxID=3346749 RepID=UPI0036A5BA75